MPVTPGWCSGSASSSGVEGARFDPWLSQTFCTFTKCCSFFCRVPIRLQIGFWSNVRVRKPLKRSPKLHNCSIMLFKSNKRDLLLQWLTATAAYCDKWLTATSGYCDASRERARSAREQRASLLYKATKVCPSVTFCARWGRPIEMRFSTLSLKHHIGFKSTKCERAAKQQSVDFGPPKIGS